MKFQFSTAYPKVRPVPDPDEYVLFDLDQTIIPWDTQLVFRSYVLRQEPLRRALTLIFLAFLPLTKVLGAGGMKRIFHSYLFGMSRTQLQRHVSGFLDDWLPQITYPEILAEIEEHRKSGRVLILSSASPELWVLPLGERLGFHHSFGTRLELASSFPLFPEIEGENHKGEEKVRRLAESKITSALAGYSDSKADLPLLALCKEKTLVNPLSKICQIGKEKGWRILEPGKPWANRLTFGWNCTKQLFGFWTP